MEIKTHTVTLRGERMVLRPLTEQDWETLLRWNNDPEVLYFAEGDDVSSHSLEDMQGIYRGVSQNAFCFMAELDGCPVGECWLQRMNLDRILQKYPDLDCRRIDLMIGEKNRWGKGLGTEMIRLLTDFAFTHERADAVFGCDIADYNPRSLRAFLTNGYQLDVTTPQPPGGKARCCYDVVIRRH
ncbi:MAG: GNAT family N-acetyltransferase [Chloroflexi bacterium]|nr:GNAT family N-acetyltransferase [Chloroflexota bacterium]